MEENGKKKLLSICDSKKSLLKIIMHYKELGYNDIKTRKLIHNAPYIDLLESKKLAITEEQEKYIKENEI